MVLGKKKGNALILKDVFIFFLFHVHVCFACMYIHVPCAWRCQEMSKRASDTLEMELQIARSHQVGAGS